MHLGIPDLNWEEEIQFPDHVSIQYVANPADVTERGVRLYFQTDSGKVGRLVFTAEEAELLSRKIRDTLIDNRITVI